MNEAMSWNDPGAWAVALSLALGLAATSGLRAFLPLLLAAVAARLGVPALEPRQGFEWLASDLVLASLTLAAIIEIAGDKIPALDHLLDLAGTLTRPVAGAFAGALALGTLDPALLDPSTATLLGVMLGAPIALGVHGLKAGARGASSAATLGAANPLLSIAEDTIALVVLAFTLLLPLVVPALLALACALILLKLTRRRLAR